MTVTIRIHISVPVLRRSSTSLIDLGNSLVMLVSEDLVTTLLRLKGVKQVVHRIETDSRPNLTKCLQYGQCISLPHVDKATL